MVQYKQVNIRADYSIRISRRLIWYWITDYSTNLTIDRMDNVWKIIYLSNISWGGGGCTCHLSYSHTHTHTHTHTSPDHSLTTATHGRNQTLHNTFWDVLPLTLQCIRPPPPSHESEAPLVANRSSDRSFMGWTHWAISRSSQCSTTGVQRPWYVLFCLWDDAYKRTLAANRNE